MGKENGNPSADIHLNTALMVSKPIRELYQKDPAQVKTKFLECLKTYAPNLTISEDNRKTMADIFAWCMRLNSGKFIPWKGLWIYGKIGVGKTTLMKGILLFIEKYWELTPYCGEIKNTKVATFEQIVDNYRQNECCDLNLPAGIDEVGASEHILMYRGNPVNVMNAIADSLMSYRNLVPRIVTTNFTLEDAYQRFGTRAFDRFNQYFELVEIVGKSHRQGAFWRGLMEERETATKESNRNQQ